MRCGRGAASGRLDAAPRYQPSPLIKTSSFRAATHRHLPCKLFRHSPLSRVPIGVSLRTQRPYIRSFHPSRGSGLQRILQLADSNTCRIRRECARHHLLCSLISFSFSYSRSFALTAQGGVSFQWDAKRHEQPQHRLEADHHSPSLATAITHRERGESSTRPTGRRRVGFWIYIGEIGTVKS